MPCIVWRVMLAQRNAGRRTLADASPHSEPTSKRRDICLVTHTHIHMHIREGTRSNPVPMPMRTCAHTLAIVAKRSQSRTSKCTGFGPVSSECLGLKQPQNVRKCCQETKHTCYTFVSVLRMCVLRVYACM